MLTVLLEQTEKMMHVVIDLDERVLQLHEIARQIEQEIAQCKLSEDIREIADRLNKILK